MVSVPFYRVAGKASLRRKCLSGGDYTDTRGKSFPSSGVRICKDPACEQTSLLESKQEGHVTTDRERVT